MPLPSNRKPLTLGAQLKLSPTVPHDPTARPPHPGDLSLFAPYGNGVYGLQDPKSQVPFHRGPIHEAEGGTCCFFGNGVSKDDFFGMLRVLGIPTDGKNSHNLRYAAYLAETQDPETDQYVTQLRLVSAFGMRFLFGAIAKSEYGTFPAQTLSPAQALWAFMDMERKRWGTSYGAGLDRVFGGDGNYAQEMLSFGFHLENAYHGICRIWSRAWLVTK